MAHYDVVKINPAEAPADGGLKDPDLFWINPYRINTRSIRRHFCNLWNSFFHDT